MTEHPPTTAARHIQFSLKSVAKSYGGTIGVAPVTLDVYAGEFFSLLGPSGCGKSTLLKLIAGFEEPTTGSVTIAGRSMVGVPPEQRNIGFVFQNYALFPHMTVAENIAFGLEARGIVKADRTRRVTEMLELVELDELGERRSNQLSGGQQQRIALARALAIRPDVLLLDEPLGALDRKLREAMQVKLVEMQRRLGVTTVFVTHDQEEALSMSDRIAVMSAQRHGIEQIGTPAEIYRRPANVRVSSFIGQVNLWFDDVARTTEIGAVTKRGFSLRAPTPLQQGQSIIAAIRPERIRIVPTGSAPTGWNQAAAAITDVIYLGEKTTYRLRTAMSDSVSVTVLNDDEHKEWTRGATVELTWPADAMVALPNMKEMKS